MKKSTNLIVALSFLLSISALVWITDRNTFYPSAPPADIMSFTEGIILQDHETVTEMVAAISEEPVSGGFEDWKSYSGTQVEEIFGPALLNYKEELTLSTHGDSVFIFYITTDNKEVFYTYHGNFLFNTCIYDPDADRLILVDENSTVEVWENFRNPSEAYTISDRIMRLIQAFSAGDDHDAMENVLCRILV